MNYMRELFLQECYGMTVGEDELICVDEGKMFHIMNMKLLLNKMQQTKPTTMFMVILIRELSKVEDWLHGNS